MKKIYLILCVLLFMPFVFAEPSYYIQQQSKTDLIINCLDSDYSYCNNTVVCTATVFYPNMSLLINNQTMTNSGTYYNYTLSTQDTIQLGLYSVMTNCLGQEENGFTSFNYEVVKFPVEYVYADSFFRFFLFVIIFCLGLGLVFFMHHFKEDEGSSVVYGFIAGTIFLLLGSILSFGYRIITINTSLPFNLDKTIGLIMFIFAFYSFYYGVDIFRLKKRKKQEKKDKEKKTGYEPL